MLGTIGRCVKALPDQEYVTIETEHGTLQGVVQVARNGDKYNSYRGIPYAQPPIDDLRWKVPKPAPKWEGVRNATSNAELCTQQAVNNPTKLIGIKYTVIIVTQNCAKYYFKHTTILRKAFAVNLCITI